MDAAPPDANLSKPKFTKLTFQIKPLSPGEPLALAVVPLLDGVPFNQLAENFEATQAFDVASKYAGLVPYYYNFGPLTCHYLPDYGEGEAGGDWSLPHRAILGCNCGRITCWALTATISKVGSTVTWSNFRHNHRPHRDYSALGRFEYHYEQYRRVIYKVAKAFYEK